MINSTGPLIHHSIQCMSVLGMLNQQSAISLVVAERVITTMKSKEQETRNLHFLCFFMAGILKMITINLFICIYLFNPNFDFIWGKMGLLS